MNLAIESIVGPPKKGEHMQIHVHLTTVKGVSIQKIKTMADILGVSTERMAKLCGFSRSTFHRAYKNGLVRMDVFKSDQLVRHAVLYDKAVEAFEDAEAAKQWLSTPQVGLGGTIPLEMARSTAGYREVEKLLTRIDCGVYA
jgi:putative toxin-antitoxin system antitoxin component (TIGR02293 family)